MALSPCAWFSSLSSTEFEFAFYFWGLQLWFVPTARGAPGMHHCSVATFGKQWFEWPLLRSAGSLARFLPPYITGSSCIGSGSWPGHYISTGLKTYRPWWAEPLWEGGGQQPRKGRQVIGAPGRGVLQGTFGVLTWNSSCASPYVDSSRAASEHLSEVKLWVEQPLDSQTSF